jgi:hypothetical protein
MIDLISDTVTRPTPAMRRVMAEAEVGDEQLGEDPSVNRLQEMVAELTGKEAALFLPSGTMCNLVGIKVHTQPGDRIIIERTAHPVTSEAGGPGLVCGVLTYSRRRCARCLHCGASRSSSRSRGWRSHATDDAGLHREYPQSGRWENLADRDAAGGVRHRASARSQGAHGWCSSAQCCRGDWSTGRDLVPLGRYRLDRSLQRTRLPGRRGAGWRR